MDGDLHSCFFNRCCSCKKPVDFNLLYERKSQYVSDCVTPNICHRNWSDNCGIMCKPYLYRKNYIFSYINYNYAPALLVYYVKRFLVALEMVITWSGNWTQKFSLISVHQRNCCGFINAFEIARGFCFTKRYYTLGKSPSSNNGKTVVRVTHMHSIITH